MNTEALFLFLILLLGLVLCSFLGGNCGSEEFTINEGYTTNTGSTGSISGAATASPVVGDYYNHYKGSMTSLQTGSTFYGPNGGKILVQQNSDGTQSLNVTLPNGKIIELDAEKQEKQDTLNKTTTTTSVKTIEKYTNYYGANGTATRFYGPNGVTASVIKGNNGQIAVHVETNQGDYTFTPDATYYKSETESTNANSSTKYYGSTGYQVNTYKGAYGGQAAVATGPYGNTAYYARGPYGNAVAGSTNPYYGTSTSQYYGPYGGHLNTATGPYGNTAYYAQGPNGNAVAGTTNPYYGTNTNQYYGPHGGHATAVTGPRGNTAYYAQGPNGNAVTGIEKSTSSSEYYSSLPPGVPGSQIPPGQEDLYILKSQVVPPVCPVCPAVDNIAEVIEKVKESKCQPCPAPQRCPEPSFECKKVPNYNSIGNDQLPVPVLNDFSTFGM